MQIGKMFEVDCDEDTEEDEDLEIKNAKRSSGKSENSADDDDGRPRSNGLIEIGTDCQITCTSLSDLAPFSMASTKP